LRVRLHRLRSVRWSDLDLEQHRVKLARNKTGAPRNLPLWPETINAMAGLPKTGPLVFYTEEGHPWVRTVARIREDGSTHYTTVNAITSMFARLLKKVKIEVPHGTGFYTLRRTAATLAARSGDPFAVQRLLGHVNLEMATRYVQDLSAQTDRVIEKSREYLVGGRSVA
jgi:integrase